MKFTKLVLSAALMLTLAALGGCTDSAPSGPSAGLGNVTVKKYVSIGNSLTAGYQSNGLYQSAQIYSYPNQIAQQLAAAGAQIGTFEQPLWSDPGTPDAVTGKAARYEIISLAGPIIGPKGLTAGVPINMGLNRPYDNLGVPGIVIASFLDTTNIAKAALLPYILRYAPYGTHAKNVYGQVVELASNPATKPDLVTFWLGNNDVLGYATGGGVKKGDDQKFQPTSPTPSAIFQSLYSSSLTALRALLPDAKIVVATIPDVRAIPFFTTVGPKMAPGIAYARSLNSALPGMFYQKNGVAGPSTAYTNLAPTGDVMITLTGSSYAGLVGKPGGKWYSDNRASYPTLPAGIDTTQLFGFSPANPWPDALVLDLDEQATAGAAVDAFNTTIKTVAASKNAAVVDINAVFNNIKENGLIVNGEEFTTDYVTGGLFSLDGVHPSSKGATIVANEFIRVMNASFGMNIPTADVSKVPGLPAPLSKYAKGTVMPTIPFDAARSIVNMMGGKL